MKQKNILLSSLLTVLLLSACGGSGGSSSDNYDSNETNTSDLNTTAGIEIIACDNSNSDTATNDCGDTETPDYYTCIQSGDTLEKQEENTIVEIITLSDNTKKVCVKSGTAYIVRESLPF